MQTFRKIKSYMRREGRFSDAQKQALARLGEGYSFCPDSLLGEHDSKRILEIGFGQGDALVDYASRYPDWQVIGSEVYQVGIAKCLMQAEARQLDNIKIFSADVWDLLRDQLPDHSLTRIHIFFPDPWPKKRHHKRRLIQPDFLEILHQKLSDVGKIYLATDWTPYAEHMMSVFNGHSGFENVYGRNHWADREDRPQTKYERRAQRLGHPIFDLQFRKLS